MSSDVTPEQFLGETDSGLAVYRWVQSVLADGGLDFTVSTSKSQVAFRRRRGFATSGCPANTFAAPMWTSCCR